MISFRKKSEECESDKREDEEMQLVPENTVTAEESEKSGEDGDEEDEDNEPEKESRRMSNIRMLISAAAIIVVIFFVIRNWSGDEQFQFNIHTDDGYSWTCVIDDEDILRVESAQISDGKYVCTLKAISEGTTEVHLTRTENADESKVAEERMYTLTVTEDLQVVQDAVERTVY